MQNGLVGWMKTFVDRHQMTLSARRLPKKMVVVETLSLGGRRQVVLVRCGVQEFLVGTSGESVTTIAPLRGDS